MKRIILAALLLAGCDAQQQAADGYYFEQPQFERGNFTVRVITVANLEELRRIAPPDARKLAGRGDIYAFGSFHQTEPRCTIVVVDPKSSYKPEWLGHELAHCMFGEWHPEQNRERG